MDLAITADALDSGRVNNYERWESREHLDAWRAVADPPKTGVEIDEAHVRMYTASDERSPFD